MRRSTPHYYYHCLAGFHGGSPAYTDSGRARCARMVAVCSPAVQDAVRAVFGRPAARAASAGMTAWQAASCPDLFLDGDLIADSCMMVMMMLLCRRGGSSPLCPAFTHTSRLYAANGTGPGRAGQFPVST